MPKRINPTNTQKHEVLEKQNLQCAECKEDLDLRRVHFHHIDGDRSNTTIDNLEAVCPNCHSELEHEKNLKKVEKERKGEEYEEEDYEEEPIIDMSALPKKDDFKLDWNI